jgi:tryptophan-rich sensory protein
MQRKHYLYLALSILLCSGIGFLAGQLTTTDTQWFIELAKPSLYPPGYLFGVVWSVLYILIGISLFLIIKKTRDKLPYILFGLQLTLNFFWTLIFFGLQNILLALIEIVVLLSSIIATMIVFRKYSKTSAYLLLPYLLWVCFATYLTLRIFLLN